MLVIRSLFAAHEICAEDYDFETYEAPRVEQGTNSSKIIFVMAPAYIRMHNDYNVHIIKFDNDIPFTIDFTLRCLLDDMYKVAIQLASSTLAASGVTQTQVKLNIDRTAQGFMQANRKK